MFNVLRPQAGSRWGKLPVHVVARHNSTAYVPPAALQHVRRAPPRKEKPTSPTFYTSRAAYFDQVNNLEATINSARQALKSEHLYPLPDFARASIPPPRPFWKDRTTLMNTGDVKMTPSRYRRVIALLNQLDEYKRIAEVAGAHDLAGSITALLSEFENDNKAAILANSKRKPVQFDEFGRTYTSGKRKESSARVWVIPVQQPEVPKDAAPKAEILNLPASAPAISAFNHPQPVQVTTSNILVNNIPLNQYFPIAKDRETVIRPLQLAGLFGAFNVFALVRGGGTTGQSGAIAVGLARGLAAHVPGVADILRKAKLLRRDPRMVERKKTNLRKARAARTWVKRSGVGRELVLHILARGDKAIATARGRSFSKLADLEARGAATYELDVNASQDDLHAFAKKIIDDHGHVDVIVNNAGYVAMGAEEASTPDEDLAQFKTNVFAPLNINRSFLPYMRARKSGWIIWIGSQAGWVVQPVFGLYAASKHALRALAVALDVEISPFGLRSVCFELSNFVSNAPSPGNRVESKSRLSAYDDATKSAYEWLESTDVKQPGDTAKAARAIVDVVRGEGTAAGRKAPSFIALGSEAYNNISRELDTARKGLEEWKDLTCSTDF